MSTMTHAPMLTVRREIEASPEELFDAWLDAESLGSWMRVGETANGVRDSDVQLDARTGGAFAITMHTATKSILHTGTYQVIDRPRRLVFTWISVNTGDKSSLVTVDFLAGSKPGHTEVVLTHEQLPTVAAAEGHTKGWTAIVNNLESRYPHL